MRIINVIVIRHGAVHEIDSYGVFEEQLSQDVVAIAEEKFKKQVLFVTESDESEFEDNYGGMETFIEDGIFQNGAGNSVCLTWSEIT